MAKKRKTKQTTRVLTSALALTLIASNVTAVVTPAHAETADDLQLSLTSNKDVDVVLTLGNTKMNVANFGNDLKNKLVEKGVNLNRINIQAVETNSQNLQESFAWNNDVHSHVGRIYFQNNGTRIQMYGNESYEGFNKIYTPNNTDPEIKEQEMSFSYSLNYGDSFDGGGVLINTHVTNGLMNGYALMFPKQGQATLFKLKNWSNSPSEQIFIGGWGANGSINSKATRIGTINMGSSGSFKLKMEKNKLTVYNQNTGAEIGNLPLDEHFGFGFGFFSDHYSHGCSDIGQFSLENVKLNVTKAKDFREVIKEPKWRDTSKRFMVNVDDQIVPDFNSSSALGEMLPRFINEQINFIGLGTTTNQSQLENFVQRNNNNGAFYSNTNYQTALENTANYIVQKLQEEQTTDGQYVLVGEPIDVSVTPSSLAKNTATPEFPQGRWRIDHNYEYFENNLGQASWANQWQKDLQMVFDKPGQYDISFGDKHPNPRYVYAHRKPVASFASIVRSNGSNFSINIQDYSYDLDMESRTDKGIVEREWKWKRTTDNSWTNGQVPTTLPLGNDYIVQLRVKDHQGAWSDPESRYITTSSVVAKPVANFNVGESTISKFVPLQISDTSYDPAGRNVTEKLWTVTKNGTVVYTGATPMTNFLNAGEGSYRIALKVKNDANLWSDEFARNITVTTDTEKPEAIVNPTSQDWSPNNAVVNIRFADKGGSGFKQQRYAVTQSATPPASNSGSWSAYSSATDINVTVSQEGKNFIHIESEDVAGNKMTRTIGEYQVDKTDPTVSYSANPSTWTNKNVTINFSARDSVSGVNRLKLPNGNWVTDTDVTYVVSTNGVQDFVVVDNAGNTITKSVNVNYIDKVTPNAPTITIDGIENTWIDQDVVATIKDNGDGGVSGFRVEYSLSGDTTQGWTTYNAPVRISNDGTTTITARVVDNAGNISSVVSKTMKIDQNAPNLTITPDIVNLTNTDIVLTAKATDSATGVKRIQLPNGNWVNGSQVTYRVSENGTYVFKSEDNFGHVRTINHVVSNIKKNVLITNKREVDLELHAEDLYSGVTHMQFRNEESAWSVWESYSTYKDWVLSPVDGLKHVWVQYKDKVGNIAPPVEDIIILDMTKPTASAFVINEDAPFTKEKSVTLKLKGSDALTGVKDIYLSNDNVNWTKMPYTEETPWVLSNGDGVKTVYLKISDVAGNISDVRTDTIFLDTTKPLANIVINNGDQYSATRDVRLTLTYSDIAGSGIETVKVIEGDREYTLPKPTPNSPITIPWTLDFGVVKTVSIVAVDKAGNVSNIVSDTIIVDKLTIKDFTLEEVVNPLEFSTRNPFTPKVWAFAPQPMLSGGNITFSVDVKKAVDVEVVQDKVDYKVEIVGDNGYHKAFVGTMRKAGDHYTQTVTMPKDAPNGAKVYASATAQRKLLVSPYDIQTVYFPGGEDASQKAQIGFIDGNIYDVIRFNETK
ncbi:hypothetical protein CVD28_24425 [Bacillus sp. M6-12]|uniref:OmpL47-type beta-barrel domain-containing protein n=1 Tax=Bacillus sp. M6-12 TaxID=2054166 RepID=UPI000C7757A4|nr:Ig-like domain repeat protein [Bacillus sp. M6-12]PLS15029.1 hypothetical protein CVD28_24425 [Bacillus sp. M6-12]